MSDVISLLIAVRNPLVRAGLRQFLAEIPSVSLVGETDQAAEIVPLTHQIQPAVVLLDYAFNEVLQQLCKYNTPWAVIVIVDACHLTDIRHILSKGAGGVITDDIDCQELEWIITQMAQKRRGLSATIQEILIEQWLVRDIGLIKPEQPDLEALTGREGAVFELVAQGLSNQQIAEQLSLSLSTVKSHVNAAQIAPHRDDQLSLSLSTVKSHVSNILSKLEVDNRTALVRLAMAGRSVDGQDETA